MPLHPGQIEYIEETTRLKTKVNVLNPANRFGKTTIIACLHIWTNFYKRGIPEGNRKAWVRALYRTANVAPSSSLIEAGFNYIDQIMTSSFPIVLPDGKIISNTCLIEWFYLKDRTRTSPVHLQFFSNNSYVEHRTLGMSASDSLEGKPFGLITYDEGGRSHHLEQEVNGTLLARLFDWNGQLHIVSTPHQNSPSILYHFELYQKGLARVDGYYTMEGQLRDNIFFPPEQIEAQYKLYEGNPLREQVLFGKFVFGGDNLFNAGDILAAKDDTLNDGERRKEGHKYVIATDTAIGADEMVHSVLDVTTKPYRLVRQIAAKGNSKSPQRHLNDFIDLYDSYRSEDASPAYILETWNGESVRFYHDLPDYIKVNAKCYGSWQPMKPPSENENKERPKTQAVKKADILLALSKSLSQREIKIFSTDPNPVMKLNDEKPGADLIQQLTIYKENDKNIPTDRLISLALACWLSTEGVIAQKEVVFITW